MNLAMIVETPSTPHGATDLRQPVRRRGIGALPLHGRRQTRGNRFYSLWSDRRLPASRPDWCFAASSPAFANSPPQQRHPAGGWAAGGGASCNQWRAARPHQPAAGGAPPLVPRQADSAAACRLSMMDAVQHGNPPEREAHVVCPQLPFGSAVSAVPHCPSIVSGPMPAATRMGCLSVSRIWFRHPQCNLDEILVGPGILPGFCPREYRMSCFTMQHSG